MEASVEILMGRYAEHLRVLNYSHYSIKNRRANLNQLLVFLADKRITGVEAISATVLAEYQRWLFYKPTKFAATARKASTLNRSLTAVKHFFWFLKEEGYITRNPSEGIAYAREPDRLPRNVLTPREAKKIVETADTSTNLGYRDRTILEVLYATGIRQGELIRLEVDDVKLEEQILVIRAGKGRRDRVVPLGKMACKFLESYIKAVRPQLLGGSSPKALFLSRFARAMSPMAVTGLVKKHALLSGVKKHVTCHLWRHTCATHLVQNRANLRHVQEILGHRNLSTTERYLSLTINDLKAAHARHHPREKDIASQI